MKGTIVSLDNLNATIILQDLSTLTVPLQTLPIKTGLGSEVNIYSLQYPQKKKSHNFFI